MTRRPNRCSVGQAVTRRWRRNIRDDLKQIQLAQLLSPNGTVLEVTDSRKDARDATENNKATVARADAELGLIPFKILVVTHPFFGSWRKALCCAVLRWRLLLESVKVG